MLAFEKKRICLRSNAKRKKMKHCRKKICVWRLASAHRHVKRGMHCSGCPFAVLLIRTIMVVCQFILVSILCVPV